MHACTHACADNRIYKYTQKVKRNLRVSASTKIVLLMMAQIILFLFRYRSIYSLHVSRYSLHVPIYSLHEPIFSLQVPLPHVTNCSGSRCRQYYRLLVHVFTTYLPTNILFIFLFTVLCQH